MKMLPEHYQALLVACTTLQEQNPLATPESYTKEGHSAERYRWDLFHAATSIKSSPSIKALYSYLNDNTIDTALKRIVSKLYTNQPLNLRNPRRSNG